jgi:hypothetical protein
MIALLSLTTLFLATLFALAAATALHWFLLQLTVRMMRPATVHQQPVRAGLAAGTAQLTRAYVSHQ